MEQNQNPEVGAGNINERPSIEIQTHRITFRADATRFQRKKTFLTFVTAMWWQAIIASIFLTLIEVANNNNPNSSKIYLPLLIQVCVFTSFLTVIGFCNQAHLNPALTYSTLVVTLYLISITILYGLQIDALWIASIIFIIFQMVVSFTFVQAPRNIILIGLLLIQLNLIFSKLDGRLNVTWVVILLILIALMVSAFFVGIILVILGVMERLGSPRFTLQSVGITYMGLIFFCYALDAAVIIVKLMFQTAIYTVAIPCAFFNLILIIYAAHHKEQICLFRSNAVVSHHLHQKVKCKKIQQYKKLYRLSSIWFSLNKKDLPKQKEVMETELVIRATQDIVQCAVCLSEQASLVWMPCGHMAVCQDCGNYLMENSRLQCVICKKSGVQVYHLDKEQLKCDQQEYLSNFCYKIQPQ